MNSLPQRWLSLSGISSVLNLTPSQVKTLHKQKLLVRIGNRPQEHRYLDPTPEYAERLRLAALMHTRGAGFKIDLPHSFILTKREVAEVMGWNLTYAEEYLREKQIPRYKAPNNTVFYSVADVRDMIFRRQGRHLAKQKAPFLLKEILAFQKRFQAAEEAIVPTDEQFKADAELQKKMAWMMKQPSPGREAMLADFLEKIELAKKAFQTLESA
jgi:hypothetical protein